MALCHIHKYLSRIRWAKSSIKLICKKIHTTTFSEANEWKGWKNLISSVLYVLGTVLFFFSFSLFWCYLQTICIRFTGRACGKFGFLALVSIVSKSGFRVWWKYTILWSSLADFYTLNVGKHCYRMITIA